MTHYGTERPPAGLLLAIEEFNREDWFACHETLEHLWRGALGETRDFYQGLIKVAGALHHWRNGNFVGALRLLDGGSSLLRRVRPLCQGVAVILFVATVDSLHQALAELGQERMPELSRDLITALKITGVAKKESGT
ncbi:MAG: DUF309 domain-containing protein [Geobacteraceae bacterium]|nr:DUF309 domain-containing protein [Geobacteraceae bacterium]